MTGKAQKPVDPVAFNKAAVAYAEDVFSKHDFHLGDFDAAAPEVLRELAVAWGEGYMAGRDSV